jgi:DNA (cytosine-5)-methyltransferase 1
LLRPLEAEERYQGKRYSHEYRKKIANHLPRWHSERDINTFAMLARDIESGEQKYTSSAALKELYTSKTGKKSNVHKYYVIRWDEQSNLIPAHLYKDGLRHIHPDSTQARSITVREAARLQGFDDDYEFVGSIGDQYKMIGNAVPPSFSLMLANAIYELLFKEEY